ncbi:hypothetical protein G6F22_019032 [Rhizopus arrhizus]|nr:hypothetical protein G6F22_019032 [Rhizopus arrhizus]
MIETAAEASEELMEKYLGGEELAEAEIINALRTRTLATLWPSRADSGKLSVVLASAFSCTLRLPSPRLSGPSLSTFTLNWPGLPVKFCTSRVTVLRSPGASTRGMLASARIGARTTVSTSRLPYWSSL